jgi:hypothetical protein
MSGGGGKWTYDFTSNYPCILGIQDKLSVKLLRTDQIFDFEISKETSCPSLIKRSQNTAVQLLLVFLTNANLTFTQKIQVS